MEGSHELAQIIDLDSRRGIETINGVRVALGQMSVQQVAYLYKSAKHRVAEAQTDVWVLEAELERRRPHGPEDAA